MSKWTDFPASSETHLSRDVFPEPLSPINKTILALRVFKKRTHVALISSRPTNNLDWPISKGLAWNGFSLRAGIPRIGRPSLIRRSRLP